MDVVLISETYGKLEKGTAVYVHEVSKNLSKSENTNVYLFVPKHSKKKKIYRDKYGRHIFQIKSNNKKEFLLNLETELDSFFKKNSIDLIHCMYGHYFHFLKKYKKKIIWTCHNLPPAENQPLFLNNNLISIFFNKIYFLLIFFKHIYLIKINPCKIIIVPSRNVYKKLIKYQSFINKKIKVVGNGTDINYIKRKKQYKKFVYNLLTISSFKYHKNLILIPEILKQLKDINLKWTIIGNKDQNNYYNLFLKKVKTYNQKKRLEIKSIISEKNKIQALEKSDLYVQLSLSEGFGIPFLEARASGLNAISTNCGAATEIIKDLGGSMIKNISSKYIANLILKNIFKTQKINKKNFKKWEWKTQSFKLRKIYEKI